MDKRKDIVGAVFLSISYELVDSFSMNMPHKVSRWLQPNWLKRYSVFLVPGEDRVGAFIYVVSLRS